MLSPDPKIEIREADRTLLLDLDPRPRHVVAIVGGAVAGSEAAALCAERGILTIVLEQNPRPYGKIEDGLPRWHCALRRQEYERIDRNLDHPLILFVPLTRLGRDVGFDQLAAEWGVTAVLLAQGAWRDRPLPVPGVEAYVDRGLVYQNPLVYWFNHPLGRDEARSRGEISDGALVVGGGLASIDVVKILNFELYARALRSRGIEVDVLDLERNGIPAVLGRHGLSPADLGVKGCALFYRGGRRDMPLAHPPEHASPEQVRKTEATREKIVELCVRKYLLRLEEHHVPVAPLVEGGRLVGLRFRRTETRGGQLVEIPGSERDVRAPLTVSSIGSIPEPIDGIPADGELYRWRDRERGELATATGVFGLGNVLTGRGNIKESRSNARAIATRVIESYLGLNGNGADAADLSAGIHAAARNAARSLVERITAGSPLAGSQIVAILERVRRRWAQIGYDGSYRSWITRVRPPDFE